MAEDPEIEWLRSLGWWPPKKEDVIIYYMATHRAAGKPITLEEAEQWIKDNPLPTGEEFR